MAIRHRLVFFLLALAMAMLANSSPSFDASIGGVVTRLSRADSFDDLTAAGRCNEKIGECIGDEEEGMMDSETNRRTLAGGRGSYISYGAMKKNSIPCKKRGSSYYGCTGHSQANPYNRGCTRIARCSRNGR